MDLALVHSLYLESKTLKALSSLIETLLYQVVVTCKRQTALHSVSHLKLAQFTLTNQPLNNITILHTTYFSFFSLSYTRCPSLVIVVLSLYGFRRNINFTYRIENSINQGTSALFFIVQYNNISVHAISIVTFTSHH